MITRPGNNSCAMARSELRVDRGCARTGNGLVDLWEASPVRLDSNEPKTDEIIDILFPGNPLLCCGWSRHRFDTRPRKHWHKLHELQFIVPNPMTARDRVVTQERQAVCARFEQHRSETISNRRI